MRRSHRVSGGNQRRQPVDRKPHDDAEVLHATEKHGCDDLQHGSHRRGTALGPGPGLQVDRGGVTPGFLSDEPRRGDGMARGREHHHRETGRMGLLSRLHRVAQ